MDRQIQRRKGDNCLFLFFRELNREKLKIEEQLRPNIFHIVSGIGFKLNTMVGQI